MFVLNVSSATKKVLVAEIVVGIMLLIGSFFVFSIESQAPTVTPELTPIYSTYISSVLQISLQYPYGWQTDPSFNGIPGIERYQGGDGFFEVGATNDATPQKGMIIKKYPKAIKIGVTTYRYFQLKADPQHIQSIGGTIEFLNQPTPKPTL